MTEQQTAFEGWAVVEMFGHQKISGYVRTEYFGQACLFRVDVPELPERETTMEYSGYAEYAGTTQWVPKGAKVLRPAEPGRSKLIGPGAVYAINPCSEEIVRQSLENDRKMPLKALELPERPKQLVAAEVNGDPMDADGPNEDDDDFEDEDDQPF